MKIILTFLFLFFITMMILIFGGKSEDEQKYDYYKSKGYKIISIIKSGDKRMITFQVSKTVGGSQIITEETVEIK